MASKHKHSTMIVHQEQPLNAAPSEDAVRQEFVTPQESFFIRNHAAIPDINAEQYRLSITGMVEIPLQLSLHELKQRFPSQTMAATLQCAGNRRDELMAVRPIPGEIPWGAGTISNGIWRGVPLREVLRTVGLRPGVRHVAFVGYDSCQQQNEQFGFGGSIPLDKALQNEVLLAYEMNDEPLSPLHGFPLRVVVPGYIGARSVKWLAKIILQDHPSTNYYQAHAYKLLPPHVEADNIDWSMGEMLGELTLNAVICSPHEGEIVSGQHVLVQGYALAGGDHILKDVEISSDGGTAWTTAMLLQEPRPWTWCFWQSDLQLPPGSHQLVVRATDSSSYQQPEDVQQIWNCKGYMNNAWHRIHISIH